MTKVKQGQNFIDKVIHQTGSWENALREAIANGISITDNPKKGQVFKTGKPTSNLVVDFFKRNNEPATVLSDVQKADIEDLGIGKMIIEDSFIIR